MSRDRAVQLTRLISEALSGTEYELIDVEMAAQPRRSVVRVYIDRKGGVTLDDCARVTRLLGDELDANEGLGLRAYVLEVSSPGVDRPLVKPADFVRFQGETATVTSTVRIDGRAHHRGVIRDVRDGFLILDQPDVGPTEIRLEDISKAHLIRDPWQGKRKAR